MRSLPASEKMKAALVNKATSPLGQLKAFVFDIDGTMYRQGPLRSAMLVRLLREYAVRPVRGWQTVRVLRAYRQAQERLRAKSVMGDISGAQVALTCERL